MIELVHLTRTILNNTIMCVYSAGENTHIIIYRGNISSKQKIVNRVESYNDVPHAHISTASK